jgi:carboxylate-amine ligase
MSVSDSATMGGSIADHGSSHPRTGQLTTVSSSGIEHAYGTSRGYTIGVEEEFQIVDPASYDLIPRVDDMLSAASESDLAHIKQELMQSMVEVATGVCTNAADAAIELTQLRSRVARLAEAQACRIASAGTHPFARYADQQVTDRPRYRELMERLRWIAQRELIFGLHVHVGIDSPEKAIYIFNHIRAYLPQMLALSANSPFWQGQATGLQSTRTKIFDSFPRSGMPGSFASWESYEQLMQRSIAAGAMEDYTYVWWDVRPHPRFGTIEVRICDAQTRISDALALAALIQATCAWLGDRFDQGMGGDLPPTMLIEENKWSAARYGLDGEFIDFNTNSRISTREAVYALIESVEPFARSLGSEEEFAALDSLLVFNGSARQLDAYGQAGDLAAVGAMLADDALRGVADVRVSG